MFRLAALLLNLCFILSCSSAEKEFQSKFNQLSPKMTADQVEKILGPPQNKQLQNDLDTWQYPYKKFVRFKDSKLTEYGDGSVLTQTKAPDDKFEGPARPIGQACKEDSHCLSDNCHFKVCSGPQNCFIPLGGMCAVDKQCCGGICDMGKCIKQR